MADEQSMTMREALGKVLGDEHADVARVGYAGWDARARDRATTHGQLDAELSGAAAPLGAGTRRGRAGSVRQRRLDPQGRAARRATRRRWHEREPGLPAPLLLASTYFCTLPVHIPGQRTELDFAEARRWPREYGTRWHTEPSFTG